MFFPRSFSSLARLWLFAVAIACLLNVNRAHALGPDKYGYTAAATTFNFEDVTIPGLAPALTTILDQIDDGAVTIPIGFNFVFYGVKYNAVSVSTNGVLSFQNVDTEYHQVDISTTAPLTNLPMICVFWHDWTFQYLGSDSMYYATLGSPGSRRLIVQWNFAQSATGVNVDTVTFQVKLFEGSNNIEFHYDDATVDDDNKVSNGRDATVGIRDINGQITGRNIEWSYNAANIADSSAIQFKAPQFAVKTITRNKTTKHTVLSCTGAPSQVNRIEATNSLGMAFTFLGNATADATGAFSFDDGTATNLTTRFYRVGYP